MLVTMRVTLGILPSDLLFFFVFFPCTVQRDLGVAPMLCW